MQENGSLLFSSVEKQDEAEYRCKVQENSLVNYDEHKKKELIYIIMRMASDNPAMQGKMMMIWCLEI